MALLIGVLVGLGLVALFHRWLKRRLSAIEYRGPGEPPASDDSAGDGRGL